MTCKVVCEVLFEKKKKPFGVFSPRTTFAKLEYLLLFFHVFGAHVALFAADDFYVVPTFGFFEHRKFDFAGDFGNHSGAFVGFFIDRYAVTFAATGYNFGSEHI